jgi:type IV secretory pathway TrbD component
MRQLEDNTAKSQLEIQIGIHKTLGQIGFLVGAGIGFLALLLGIIGSLLIFGVSKNPAAWVTTAIGLLDCLIMIWLAQRIEKHISQHHKKLTQ